MRSSTARIAAGAMLVVGLVASVALLFTRSDEISIGLAFTSFLLVGTLLIARRPAQPIGWMFASGSLLYLVGDLAASHVQSPTFSGWPGTWWAGASLWLFSWYFFPAIALLVPLPALLFPTGSLLSARWRVVAALTILGVTMTAGAGALAGITCVDYESTVGCLRESAKPLGIGGWRGEESAIAGLGVLLLFGSSLVALGSVVVRFRRSRGSERAQMKWFVLGMTAAVATSLAAAAVDAFRLPVDFVVVYSLGIAALPVTVGVAILRYHLYDIDRIINRTVAYAVVVALLAAVFVTISAVPTIVLGTGSAPPWLIAASTLVVFALFNPLRRRVQRSVDRRFNRLPYDAEALLHRFGSGLRDAIEPSHVTAAWLSTTNQALAPVRAGVWMRNALGSTEAVGAVERRVRSDGSRNDLGTPRS